MADLDRILDDNFASENGPLDLGFACDDLQLLLGPVRGRVLGIALECVLVGREELAGPKWLLATNGVQQDWFVLLPQLLE